MHKYYLTCILLFIGYISYSQIDSSLSITSSTNLSESIQTVISHKEIESSHSKTLASLLNEQAGMVVNGAYQPIGSFINIYMEGYVGGKVLIEIDGLPVWDPASIAENYFDINFIPLSIIEKIIITHGCHSTEDGSGAVAGVINIITRKAQMKSKLNIVGKLGVGNRNSFYKNIQLWGVLQKFKYQINYSGYETKGFSDAQDTTGKKGFDNDGFKSSTLNTNIEYKANKDLNIFSYLLYSKYRADTDADDFIDAENYYYKNSFLNTGIGFNYLKNSLSITGNYKYSNVTRAYYDVDINSEKLSGIAQLVNLIVNNSFNKQFSVCGGIECRHNELKDYFTDTAFGTIQNRYPETIQYGSYTMLKYRGLNNRYTASVGYRINNYNKEKTDYCYYISNSYKISEAFKLITKINSGYTTPSIYTSRDSSIGNKSLVSEQAINFQFGLEWKKDKWENKLIIFNNNLRDGIDFNSNIDSYSNCNRFKIWGFEYEGAIQIKKFLKVQLNYSLISGEETTISRQNALDTTKYHYILRIPKNNINCKLKYEPKKKNYLSIGFKYVNDYYDVSAASEDYKMKAYFLINMDYTMCLIKGLSLNFNIQNLLNNDFKDTRGYNSIPILVSTLLQVNL